MTHNAKTITIGATALAAATILSALGFQHIGGYIPCDLCYEQRNPYYVGVPLLLIGLFIWNRINANYVTILLAVAALIFAYGTWMAGYHSGVEWGWWPGPDTCTGVGAGIADFSQLENINDTVVIPCDRAQSTLLRPQLCWHERYCFIGDHQRYPLRWAHQFPRQ